MKSSSPRFVLIFITSAFLFSSRTVAQHAESLWDPEEGVASDHQGGPPAGSFQAHDGGWGFMPDYPGNQRGLYGGSVYVVVNDTPHVMVFGGYSDSTATPSDDVWSWNTVTQTWVQKANLPNARFYHHVAVVQGKVYIISGSGPAGSTTPVDSTLEYNPVTDTYTLMSPIPVARNWGGIGVWRNRLIYIIGGSTTGTATYVNDTYLYEPETDTWAPVTNLGTVFPARRSHSASVVNGPDSSFLVVAGGFGASPTFRADAYEARIDSNDLTTLRWAQIPNIPAVGLPGGTFNGVSRTAGATYGRYHLVMGGQMSFTPVDTVFRYSKQIHAWNTVTKTWERFSDKNYGTSNMIFCAYSPQGEVWHIGSYGTPSGGTDVVAAGSKISESTLNVATDVGNSTYERPTKFSLEQNFPNPFNPSTTVRYTLPEAARVSLSVYNLLGQQIASLVEDNRNAGSFEAVWNGRSNSGSEMGSGVYFYRLDARTAGKTFSTIRKMLLIR